MESRLRGDDWVGAGKREVGVRIAATAEAGPNKIALPLRHYLFALTG